MNWYKIYKGQFYFLIIAKLLTSCANIVAPTGGANDTKAPEIVHQFPINNTINFSDNTLKFHFDEYVEVNDIQNNIIFSPPLQKPPIVFINGKTVSFKIDEILKPNTTYHINFMKDAIKDFHAGNSIKESTIIFSTGPQIDSSKIVGVVINLGNIPADKKVKVVLTNTKDDFIKGNYAFVTGVDVNNYFYFKNLPNNGKYYIYSFIDENVNNKIDSNEVIGFRKNKFIAGSKDTTYFIYQSKPDEKQKLISFKNTEVGKLELEFSKKVSKLQIESDFLKQSKSITELSKDKKKVTVWYNDISKESARFSIKSNNEEVNEEQDINLISKSKVSDKELQVFIPNVNKNRDLFNKNQNPQKPILFELNRPIIEIDSKKLIILEDSIKPITATFKLIDKNKKIEIVANWKEGKKYYFVCKDSALLDIINILNINFSSLLNIGKKEEFGQIDFVIKKLSVTKNYVIKVYREKEEIYAEIISNKESTKILLKDQPIGNYKVEAIVDDNKNGEWNAGNFYLDKQPEEIKQVGSVVFKAGGIDLEQEFEIKK